MFRLKKIGGQKKFGYKIFGVRKNIGSKKNVVSKKTFGLTKNVGPKNCGSKIFFALKNFWCKKICSKNI